MKANEMVTVGNQKGIVINYNSEAAVVRFVEDGYFESGITTEVSLSDVLVN